MASKREKEVVEVGVDVQQALADMTKMQRATTKNFDQVAKAVDKLNKVNRKATSEAEDGADRWEAGIHDLTKAYKQEGKEIQNVLENIELLQKKSQKASDAEKENLDEQIKSLKKIGAEKIKALKGKENKEGRAAADKMFKDARGELKSALKETISSVFSKDLKGVVENSAKTLVKGLKLSAAGGLKIGHMGGGLMDRGRSKGGMGGAAMQAGGAAMKGVGSMMGGIKPLIEGLTKIGPILGTMAGAVLGLVKLFLDMDAKVKDFNKDILQSASNTEFLAQAGGNTDLAFSQMQDTLDGIRNAAYDLSNIQLGISPDEYKGMINTLTQEGVSLRSIGTEAARSGKTVQDFTSDLAHVSVAYSRAFGVPLQEINTLQAEMMTEMGSDLDKTKMSFEQMTRAADDSGISANKFFGMIRGVSQDLSLWGTRMEDAVKLLGRLGKVMNPRNAQKFMQTAVQGLKNMGRTERLRLTLLTGQGKMGKLIERDTKRKATDIAKTLGMTTDDLIDKMQKQGPAGLDDAIDKLPKEMQGATREALIDMQLQQKRSKKGTFGTATAGRNLGPAAALEAMQGALVKFGGGKKLSDIVGTIGGEMMAENLGISEDQLDSMAKFESSIDSQRDVLKKQLESNDANQQEAAREALKKAGITASDDKELKKKIDGAGYDEIMDTLSDGDKKAVEGEAKIEDMSRKQADLQTSMLKKLEMILNFLMNQMYNIMVDIWDLISSIFGKKDEQSLQKAVYQAHDPGLMKIFDQTRGDIQKFREDLINKGGLGKGIGGKLDAFLNAKDGSTEKARAGFDVQNIAQALDKGFSIMEDKGKDAAEKSLKAAGVQSELIDKVKGAMDQGESFSQAMSTANVSEKDRAEAMKKSLWFLDPSWLAQISKLRDVSGDQDSTGTSQASSAAKSAATGTASGGQAAVAAVGGSPSAQPAATKDMAAATQDNLALSKDQLATMQSVDAQMDKFKMDTSFLSGPYSKAVEGSVLKAVRTALFEYYMYKDLDKGQVVNAMTSGGLTPSTLGASFTQNALHTGDASEASLTAMSMPANAAGGTVSGVNGGLAMVTAAAGEGLASVGPGERIVPRSGSGGGDTYQINVQGVGGADLAKFIESKVIDGVYEYKRKERFST